MVVCIDESAGATASTATSSGLRAILAEQMSRQFASHERFTDATYSSEQQGRGELVLLNKPGKKGALFRMADRSFHNGMVRVIR